MLFDSHAHYYEKFPDREELLAKMPSLGVSNIMVVPSDVETSKDAIELAGRYDFCYAAAGIHPHESKEYEHSIDEAIKTLRELANDKKCMAIGEMGLDYALEFSPKEVQKTVFTAQLKLAKELDLPIIVHSRDAMEDTINMLKDSGTRGVIHCYSGSAESAKILVKMGYYISFAGVLTFKNARQSHEAAKAVPRERIMIETDCPYLAPVPFRGKRCDSSMVRYTCEKLAELLEIEFEEAAKLTKDNAKRCFGIV